MLEFRSPTQMASHLAGYIKNPTTLRVRVLEEFGRAPSVDQCRNLIAAKQPEPKRNLCDDKFGASFLCGHPETEANTVLGLNGRGQCLICEEAKEVAREQREAQRAMRERARKARERLQAMRINAEVEAKATEKFMRFITPQTGERPKLSSHTLSDVAQFFDMTVADLKGQCRERRFVDARTALSLIMKADGLSYPQIGRLMGRDHTSIMNLIKKAKYRIEANPRILECVEALR